MNKKVAKREGALDLPSMRPDPNFNIATLLAAQGSTPQEAESVEGDESERTGEKVVEQMFTPEELAASADRVADENRAQGKRWWEGERGFDFEEKKAHGASLSLASRGCAMAADHAAATVCACA